MDIIEQNQHQNGLRQLFSNCLIGKGQVSLLHGAVASGKTELLNSITEHATSAGGLVLRAACSYTERALPLGVLDQLIRSVRLPDNLAEKASQWFDRAAAEVAVDGHAPEVIGHRMAQVFHGLCRVLLELADSAPVLVGIDDIHYADDLSLHCLLYLIRRLGSARMMVVLTDNPGLSALHPTFRTELLDHQNCNRVELELLSSEDIHQLLTKHFGRPTADRQASKFLTLSGGNPLLVKALIEQHATGEVHTEGYGRAVRCLVHRSGAPSLLQTAWAIAVLGDDVSPERLSFLADIEPQRVDQVLRVLTAAGLLVDGKFRHESARLSVLEDLPAEDLVELHTKAAKMLHEQGCTATQVARFLLAARTIPGPWAVNVLLESAEKDQRDGRLRAAIAALDLAHRGCTAKRERAAVASMLVQAQWQSTPASACPHFEPLISAAIAAKLDDRNCLRLVHQLLWHGWSDAAADVLAVLRRSVTDSHSESETELTDTELWISWTYPPLAAQPNANWAATQTRSWPRPTALLASALLRGRGHEVIAQAEQVLGDRYSIHCTSGTEEPTMLALSVLIAAGRAGSAAAWCDRLMAKARTQYSPTWKALLCAAQADAAVRQGDLIPAFEHSQLALNYLSPKSWGVAIGFPLGSLILATTRMGRFDEAARYLARPVPKAMFQSRYGLHYLYARGHYYLATGHPHAALGDFQSCGELMRSWSIDVPGVVPWRTSAAETLLKLGHRDKARRLVTDRLVESGTLTSLDRGLSLRLLAATAQNKRRVQLLTEALEILEECGDQYEQIRTLIDLSDAYNKTGDSKRARMHSRRARRMAGMCGGAPLSQALLALYESPENVPSATKDLGLATPLTESECRVAALAVQGYTNREIATKLFISASTVEQHLTRVYRKLGVKNRKALPSDLRKFIDEQGKRHDPARVSFSS